MPYGVFRDLLLSHMYDLSTFTDHSDANGWIVTSIRDPQNNPTLWISVRRNGESVLVARIDRHAKDGFSDVEIESTSTQTRRKAVAMLQAWRALNESIYK